MRRATCWAVLVVLTACESPKVTAPAGLVQDVARSNEVVAGSGKWDGRRAMAGPREFLGAAASRGRLYVMGGLSTSSCLSSLGTMESYDPERNVWSAPVTIPGPRWGAAVASLGNHIYVVGGLDMCTPSSAVQRYDPKSARWRTLADVPFAERGVSSASAVDGGGTLYVLGGTGGGATTDFAYAYDTTANSWAARAGMPGKRSFGAAAYVNGVVYYMGGVDDSQIPRAELFAYDTSANSWATLAPMPIALRGIVAGTIKGIIYVTGGSDASNFPAGTTLAYNPTTDTWTSLATAPGLYQYGAGAVIDSTLYTVGGNGLGGNTASLHRFTPAFAGNHAPEIISMNGPYVQDEGQQVNFSVTVNDLDGDNLTYSWDFGDGQTSTAAAPSHTYGTANNYLVHLHVHDAQNVSANRFVVVNVISTDPAVTLAPADTTVFVGETLHHSGSFTDPGSSSWTAFGKYNDHARSVQSLSGQTFGIDRTFTEPADLSVTATVKDDKGGVGQATSTVHVRRAVDGFKSMHMLLASVDGGNFASADSIVTAARKQYGRGQTATAGASIDDFKTKVDVLVGGGADAASGAFLKAFADRLKAAVLSVP